VIGPVSNGIPAENQNFDVATTLLPLGKISPAVWVLTKFMEQSEETISLVRMTVTQKLESLGAQMTSYSIGFEATLSFFQVNPRLRILIIEPPAQLHAVAANIDRH